VKATRRELKLTARFCFNKQILRFSGLEAFQKNICRYGLLIQKDFSCMLIPITKSVLVSERHSEW